MVNSAGTAGDDESSLMTRREYNSSHRCLSLLQAGLAYGVAVEELLWIEPGSAFASEWSHLATSGHTRPRCKGSAGQKDKNTLTMPQATLCVSTTHINHSSHTQCHTAVRHPSLSNCPTCIHGSPVEDVPIVPQAILITHGCHELVRSVLTLSNFSALLPAPADAQAAPRD
jgi:hypothetical protein